MLRRTTSVIAALLCCSFMLSAHAESGLASFEIVSGDLPPFADQHNATHPGALVELVELLTQKLKQPNKVQFFPWARAIATAQSQNRVAILPFTRTPEREAQFTWLVKLYAQRFVAIRYRAPVIDKLEQLRGLRIAVLRGSPTHMFLIRNHFKPELIQAEAKNENMLKALDHGLVDVIYGSEQINLEVIKKSGRKLSDYHFGAMLDQGEIWLAGGKGFSSEDIRVLNAAMEALQKDGNYDQVMKKYGLK